MEGSLNGGLCDYIAAAVDLDGRVVDHGLLVGSGLYFNTCELLPFQTCNKSFPLESFNSVQTSMYGMFVHKIKVVVGQWHCFRLQKSKVFPRAFFSVAAIMMLATSLKVTRSPNSSGNIHSPKNGLSPSSHLEYTRSRVFT